MPRPLRPVWLPPNAPPRFPDPTCFAKEGLLAGGGCLEPGYLLEAYRNGIFPWYQDEPVLWWSPDPRAIVDPEHLHVSRSLARALRKSRLEIRVVPTILETMRACGEREEGTWVTEEMLVAYEELARRGHAVAFEVRDQGELVGGLYGVLMGTLFAAESKFHRRTDASKLALVASVHTLFDAGVELFDVQFVTTHLSTLGIYEIPRVDYVARARLCSAKEPLKIPFGVDLRPGLSARYGAFSDGSERS